MSQHDLVIDNQTFPATRADINSFLTAISTQQSGASAPPTTVQFQYFADTTNNLLTRRDVGDTTFLPFDTLLDSRVETKTVNYTHLLADMRRTLLLDGTSGDLTVDLLDAAVAGNGFSTTFKRLDASVNTVTIDGFGGQTIDGAGTFDLLGQNTEITIISNGTNWFIISAARPNPQIVDRIRLTLDETIILNTGTYQIAGSFTSGDSVAFEVWDKFLLSPGKVELHIYAFGTVTVDKILAVRISRALTIIFEEVVVPFGNMDGGSPNFRMDTIPDLSTGHATNLDLSVTDAPLINKILVPDSLTIEFRRTDAAPTSGTVVVPYIEFVLLK